MRTLTQCDDDDAAGFPVESVHGQGCQAGEHFLNAKTNAIMLVRCSARNAEQPARFLDNDPRRALKNDRQSTIQAGRWGGVRRGGPIRLGDFLGRRAWREVPSVVHAKTVCIGTGPVNRDDLRGIVVYVHRGASR